MGLDYTVMGISCKVPTITERHVGIGQAIVEVTIRFTVIGSSVTYYVSAVGMVTVVREDSQTDKLGVASDWNQLRQDLLNSGSAARLPNPQPGQLPLSEIIRFVGSSVLVVEFSDDGADMQPSHSQTTSRPSEHLASQFAAIFDPRVTYHEL